MSGAQITISIVVVILIIIVAISLTIVLTSSPPPSSGCINNSQCTTGTVCINSVCRSTLNSPCTSSDQCISPLVCLPNSSNINVCSKDPTNTTISPNTSPPIPPTIPPNTPLNTSPNTAPNIPSNTSPNTSPDAITIPIVNPPIFDQDPIKHFPIKTRTPKRQKDHHKPNNKPNNKINYMEYSNSLDSENNSCGSDHRNYDFDVKSGFSSDIDSELSEIISPCQQQNGIFYCNPKTQKTNPVIDVCTYSNSTIFLLENGNIIKQDTDKQLITNNVKLNRLVTFNGYIYGTNHNGTLFVMLNVYYNTPNWLWEECLWAPKDITWMSNTHDSKFLWLATDSKGILYDQPDNIISEVYHNVHNKRIYGKDCHTYLDINIKDMSATLYPNGKIITNIYDGAISYYNDVLIIKPEEKDTYRKIAIINWKPYYLLY